MTTHPHILVIVPELSPSAVVNVINPLEAMAQRGLIDLIVRLERETQPSDLLKADALVLCRNWEPVYRPIYALVLRLGIPILYDLDDHVLLAPQGSHTHQIFQTPGRREMFTWLLAQAALVRVHSPHLAQAMSAYSAHTAVVWAAIDWSLVPPDLPPLTPDPVHIVYAAQRDTAEALYPLMRADLHRALSTFGQRVRLHFLGYSPPDLQGHPLVIHHAFNNDYRAFFSQFTRAGYAIGLAPMIDDLFHNCKTNIKFRDYAAAGAAGIYADTPLYRDNGVIDGETGLLISGAPGTWFEAIARLVDDPDLLQSIRVTARRAAEARYHIDVVAETWMAHFAALPARPPLSEQDAAALATLRWPFTYVKGPDAPLVARLRRLLRGVMPVRWRLFYYDARQAIRMALRSGRKG